MKFVSYAQNYEDVMLWRALKNVECGFYIDVGANDPDIDSVTRAFYDRGWSGINIEPEIRSYEKLREKRTRDINLQMAAWSEKGELLLYEIPDTGLSTFYKPIAYKHRIERGYPIYERKISVDTLTSIWQQYHRGIIHFLKIDTEGSEENVLKGIDLSIIRPWIIIVESTLPNTQIEHFDSWDFLITGQNYEFVYFDGLNRYYVAHEHRELKLHFKVPINIFDDFISHHQLTAELKAMQAEEMVHHLQEWGQHAESKRQEAESKAKEAESKAKEAESKAKEAESKAQQAERQALQAESRAQQAEAWLSSILSSRFWRFTTPLRWVSKTARWLVQGSVAWLTFKKESRPQRVLRGVLTHIKFSVSKHPVLKAAAVKLLSALPRSYARIRSVSGITSLEQIYTSNPMLERIEKIETLSPRARRIYFDFKAAIEQRQKDVC